MQRRDRLILGACWLATFAPAMAAEPDPLRAGFAAPPPSARPRVWWHWMNGNVTQDGIAKDIAWMQRVGIGGLQMFDANLTTPQIVPERLVYMTPAWREALRTAATLADRAGLELAIASSPGWSETGGPWVTPADGLKKLVWSETNVAGGRPFTGRLPVPPGITGPFQTLPLDGGIEAMISGVMPPPPPTYYADVAVLAYPVTRTPGPSPAPQVLGADGRALDGAALLDGDPATALALPAGSPAAPPSVTLVYPVPQTMRAATVFVPGAKLPFRGAVVAPRIEASDDGMRWRPVADVAVTEVPTTVAFAPVTARRFRLVLAPSAGEMANMGAPAPGAVLPDLFGPPATGRAPPIRLASFALSPEPTIDQFEQKAGFAIARDYYALASSAAPGEAGPAPDRVIDLTARLRPDGTLDWTPPPGDWRVLRLGSALLGTTNHPATPEATGLEVDKFDGAAVRRYLDHYLGLYRDAVGGGLIGAHGIRAMLTDSIEVGAANWTPRLIAQFRRLRGYDPTPWLPALAGALIGTRAQSDAFLYDYRRTLADLIASEHYGTVATVAHEHGLTLYGEALEDNRPSLGDDMAMRAHADVPMAAMWTFARAQGPNPSYLADIKGAASVAHVYGQNLVAAESMTAALSPWAFAPADLRRIIDLEFATGVNRPVIHTSVHQPVDDKLPGLSLFIFGQYFNRHETWAEMAKAWVDYMARNAFLLQQGRNVADVAYFYGEEAPLTALYGQHPVADAPTRYAYDFVDPDAVVNRLTVENGQLTAKSGARYRLLYLGGSSARMTLAMLRRIAALAEAGAIVVGEAPRGSPHLGDDPGAYRTLVARLWSGRPETIVGEGRVIAGRDVERVLATLGLAPDFTTDDGGADLRFVHRRLADGDLYFVNNRADGPVTLTARFRVAGREVEIWRADSGAVTPASYRITDGVTAVPLTIAAEDSFYVLFRKAAVAPSRTVTQPAPTPLAPLAGGWSVAFQPGRGAPASLTLATLGSLSEQPAPGVRYFSGVATYTTRFTLPAGARPGAPLLLDLGAVGDVAEVSVNGRPVGTAWHAPYRLDIGAAVTPGANLLEVRVADLWVNRLIGDAQPGAAKITWTAMPTYRADAPLRPSGLIGPVRLLVPGPTTVTR